jgi:thiol-disulfide isomerase/thioredoxin
VLLLLTDLAFAAPEMIPEEAWDAAKNAAPASAADFEIPLKDGGLFRMADHKGEKVLLTFWASWCSPCRKELPALSSWAKGHPEVTVLAVNVDRTSAEAEGFVRKVSFDLPVAYDPEAKHLGQYGVMSMPTMLLFDKKGALAWRHTGYGEERGLSELDVAVGGVK